MSTENLTQSVEQSLAALIELAAKDAEPIRAQIAKIRGDVAAMNEGDFAVPALNQAIAQLEKAEQEAISQSKDVLGKIIMAVCKKHGVTLAPVRVGNGKPAAKRLSDKEKARASQSILKGDILGSGISRSEAASLAGITPEQATAVLKQLVDDELLVREGTGKNTRYKAKTAPL